MNQNDTVAVRRGWTSASNAEADSLCAGRHQAQAGLAEIASEDAAAGSKIHAALKRGDNEGLDIDQSALADSCRTIEAKLVASFMGGAPATCIREMRYWVSFRTPSDAGVSLEYRHSGQADAVYRSGIKALIVDYKSLRGDVAASPKNLQLRDLAVLVKGHYKLVARVAVAIIQPLATTDPELCEYGPDDLIRAEAELCARVKASNLPGALRTAGEKQCKYCLAKTRCDVYAQWSASMLPVPADGLWKIAMERWTPEQRAIVAEALRPAKRMLELAEKYLLDGSKSHPGFVPGWAAVPGGRREEISDSQECFNRFIAIGGKAEDFMPTVKIVKGKLREAVWKVMGSSKKDAESALAAMLSGITSVSQNAPSLKKESEL